MNPRPDHVTVSTRWRYGSALDVARALAGGTALVQPARGAPDRGEEEPGSARGGPGSRDVPGPSRTGPGAAHSSSPAGSRTRTVSG